MTDWITDAHGNRASITYWDCEAKARASLATLTNCKNCIDCSDCSGCSGVKDASSPFVVGPIRSDGMKPLFDNRT